MFANLGNNQPQRRPVFQPNENDTRYAFLAQYFDKQADMMKQYQILFYVNDGSIEIYDVKAKRIFLKKIQYPQISLDDLYAGNVVLIYGRQYQITGYSDSFTTEKFRSFTQKTCVIVISEGIKDLGSILELAENNGLKVTNIRMVELREVEAKSLYDNTNIIRAITQGPVIAIELTGSDAIEKWKSLMTNTPSLASNSTIDAQTELDFYFSKEGTAKPRENSTLGIIKPHAVSNGQSGSILREIIEAGFIINRLEMLQLDTTNAEDFLEVYKGVLPEYADMVNEYSSGSCIVFEIYHSKQPNDSAVEPFRELCGPYDPELARLLRPQSIRGRFGKDKVRNAIHCTDLEEDASLEVDFFFRIMKM